MCKNFVLLLCLICSEILVSQNIKESDIIGEWKFIELQDENGDKQTQIPNGRFGTVVVENVNRDSYVFDSGGEYQSWNPYNKSTGTWFFDSINNEINLELRIATDDPHLNSLKEKGIVKKREDGLYYQKPVKKRILFFSKDSMNIADRDKYYLVYKRG